MLWQTSPAATELEELVMEWLHRMLGLPESFRGVIQDTASTSTLCALLCARERATDFDVNKNGIQGRPEKERLRIYTSSQAHSSVGKGAKIAGYGSSNVVLVAVDKNYAMDTGDLERKIQADLAACPLPSEPPHPPPLIR
jgi:aromatic-L-amino-acid/L-tryptophan decarboxylase